MTDDQRQTFTTPLKSEAHLTNLEFMFDDPYKDGPDPKILAILCTENGSIITAHGVVLSA